MPLLISSRSNCIPFAELIFLARFESDGIGEAGGGIETDVVFEGIIMAENDCSLSAAGESGMFGSQKGKSKVSM
jgi:hypothetical protein